LRAAVQQLLKKQHITLIFLVRLASSNQIGNIFFISSIFLLKTIQFQRKRGANARYTPHLDVSRKLLHFAHSHSPLPEGKHQQRGA
jgi:hypothetical protein